MRGLNSPRDRAVALCMVFSRRYITLEALSLVPTNPSDGCYCIAQRVSTNEREPDRVPKRVRGIKGRGWSSAPNVRDVNARLREDLTGPRARGTASCADSRRLSDRTRCVCPFVAVGCLRASVSYASRPRLSMTVCVSRVGPVCEL